MFISPKNIELNKLVKKKTFNFDTANRSFGNLILIGTDTYDDYTEVITSRLFKPQQLYAVYTPRKVRPMGRLPITYSQKDMYTMLREKTHNFLKIGKALPSAYVGRNLLYNIIPEYTETYKLMSSIKKANPTQHLYMETFLSDMVENITNEMNYEDAYLIFPMTKYIPDFKKEVQLTTSDNHTPLIEFLKLLRSGTLNKSKFSRISRIIFYNPFADAMVVMDPQDPGIIEDFLTYFSKLMRLNNFNNKSDMLDDIVETEESSSEEDNIANTKEKIKEIVISNVSKKLKANLEDYEAADMNEKGIISSIDKKIDTYLSKPENTTRSFKELVKDVEEDKDVTANAIRYVESKRIDQKQLIQLAKNIDRETEVINSIEDLVEETDKFVVPEKVKANIPDIINKKVQYSSLNALDRKYNETQAKYDLVSCITAFSEQEYLPITIVDWKMEDTSDDFTYKDTLTVRYKTDQNKTLSFKIDIPKIFDGHYIKLKGNVYIIEKQITRLPIVKTKENTVEITTNFNKITCDRTNGNVSRKMAYLKKILQRYKTNPRFNIEYGNNIKVNNSYNNDFEYDELSSFLIKLSTMNYDIDLNRSNVETEASLLSYPDNFITNKMTPIGFKLGIGQDKVLLYIENTEIYKAENVNGNILKTKIANNLYDFIVGEVLGDDPTKTESIPKTFIYSKAKFIGVIYPIFVLCGLIEGITTVLKKAKIRYKVSDTKLPSNINWVEVKFKNKYFYYEDTQNSSMLLSVLSSMHTNDWDYEDFDRDEPYTDYCVNMLGQPIYVKQTVRINISKLIDPITRDVLNYLKLPTDPVSLLILANNMLTSNSFIPKNDLCNYRIRGNESMYAVLYEIIAKAYYNYQNSKLNGSNKEALKIPQNALISAMLALQNVSLASQLNPILELEAGSNSSMRGHKGVNLRQAYTMELRDYNPSMNGIISANSTAFSGSAGIARALTINPKINHVRGFMPTFDLDSLDATNRLSVSEILSYGTSTHSDPPRTSMQVGQSKHGVPINKPSKILLGSGYDHVVPYVLSDNFCFKAKKDGIVESIDDKNKIVILYYNDGTHDAIDLRNYMAKNSGSGFYINQTYTLKYGVNESFNAGDVIAYNPSFFIGKGNDCVFTQGTLAKIAITPGDFVFEDSTYISEKLGEKCATDITMAKDVSLGPNTIIHKIVKVGDHVDVNDELLNFTTSFSDPTTTNFLQDLLDTLGEDEAEDLGNEKILSKYAGTVSDIDIFYNVPFETLSPSLQKLINEYNSSVERRKSVLKQYNIHKGALRLKTVGQQNETKINGTEFEGVLIIFYVTHKDTLSIGDKLVYSVALKGIVSKVASNDEAPRSSYRPDEIIDGCSAASGVPSRMTMDIFHQLYGNKLLIELGRWIHEEWNK